MLFKGIKIRLLLVVILVPLLFVACQTQPPPDTDFVLAKTALDAARSAEAAKHSPQFWFQAEDAFRKARLHYRRQEWVEAQQEFRRSRAAAEKAENAARLIRQKSGEFL